MIEKHIITLERLQLVKVMINTQVSKIWEAFANG